MKTRTQITYLTNRQSEIERRLATLRGEYELNALRLQKLRNLGTKRAGKESK